MVATETEQRRRRRGTVLFLITSVLAHGALAGLLAILPSDSRSERVPPSPIPLALFVPGEGPGAAAAQPPAAEPPIATGGSPGAERAAPPRRGPRHPSEARVASPSTETSETSAPDGAALERSGEGDDPRSADAFLDALLAGSGPRRAQPGACPDPIIGTWRATRFDRRMNKTAEFLLRIRDHDGRRITGRITLRAWSGRTSRPPRCGPPGVFSHTVRMPARGTFADGTFALEALSFTRVSHCEDPGFQYNLDHFTGTVSGDRAQAVNNDGGNEVDTPYAFERIACH